MRYHRLVGVLALLLVCASMAWANELRYRLLPSGRFMDWAVLQSELTDKAVDQVWRQRLYNLPKDVDGYTMVSYRVIRAATRGEAETLAKELSQRRRFNDYVSKGYTVTAEPWPVQNFSAVKFIVRGTDYLSDRSTLAHHADLYTFAVNAEEYMIWLEVRQVTNAADQATADRASEKLAGRTLAEDLVDLVFDLWNSSPDTPPPPVTPPRPADPPPVVTPPRPADPPPVVTPPTPVDPPPVVTPPTPADPPPVVTPPRPVDPPPVVTPPTPADPPPVVTPPTPVDPPPVVTPPRPADPPPVVTPPPPAEPLPGTRVWTSADKWLQLTIPETWTVTGQQKVIFAGLPKATITLFAPETYASADELNLILQDFAESQQVTSSKNYTQQAFRVDDVTGLQVHYTNTLGHNMHVYCFGKGGRLWRLDCELDGDVKRLPPVLEQMMASLKVIPPSR